MSPHFCALRLGLSIDNPTKALLETMRASIWPDGVEHAPFTTLDDPGNIVHIPLVDIDAETGYVDRILKRLTTRTFFMETVPLENMLHILSGNQVYLPARHTTSLALQLIALLAEDVRLLTPPYRLSLAPPYIGLWEGGARANCDRPLHERAAAPEMVESLHILLIDRTQGYAKQRVIARSPFAK